MISLIKTIFEPTTLTLETETMIPEITDLFLLLFLDLLRLLLDHQEDHLHRHQRFLLQNLLGRIHQEQKKKKCL